MGKDVDILIPGEINPDLIMSDEALEPRFGQHETLVKQFSITIGSSSAIFACATARLGLKTTLVGVVGADLFGDYMRSALAERGVDTSQIIIDPHLETGISVILNRGADRAILTYPGAISALKADQVEDSLLNRSRHLHVCSLFLQKNLLPGLPAMLQRAKAYGLTVSLDTNWDPQGEWLNVHELLGFVDVFLPNEQEAMAITTTGDVHSALEMLSKQVKVVAIKRGKQGAIACDGKQVVEAEALKTEVVDTVGAGDSFNAGFLYGFLNQWSLERSLRMGVVCGSLSTRSAGGTTAQPYLEEAIAYL